MIFFENILDELSAKILVTDDNLDVLFLNKSAEDYLCTTLEESKGKNVDKVFKEKARIEDSIYFLKISYGKTHGMKDGKRYKYAVNDEDGPLRYSMELNRYDFLRVAKAMLDDWKNDTCVGKYLKTIHERRISKNTNKSPLIKNNLGLSLKFPSAYRIAKGRRRGL